MREPLLAHVFKLLRLPTIYLESTGLVFYDPAYARFSRRGRFMPEWNLVSYFTAYFKLVRSPEKGALLLMLVALGSFALVGCSGLASDQLTSRLLQERPILMPEDVESGAPTLANSTADQTQPEPSEPSTKVPFRFSADVPQPNFSEDDAAVASNDFPGARQEVAAKVSASKPVPVATILSPLPAAQGLDGKFASTESGGSTGSGGHVSAATIQLAAHTVPVTDVADSMIQSRSLPLLKSGPRVVALADAAARGVVESRTDSVRTIEAGAVGEELQTEAAKRPTPQLSPAELRQVTGERDWTAGHLDAGAIDLTHLEMPEPAETVVAKPPSLTSSQHLSRTVELLRRQLSESATPQDSLQVSVRLLELLQRKIDSATRRDVPMTNNELSYWQQQVDALALMMQTQPIATEGASDQQVHESAFAAIERLERATDHLRALAGLRIRGGQLCSQISGFGQYELLDSNVFNVGDQALLYVEVENFESQESSVADKPQWATRLQASYAVYDSTGRVVQQEQYPIIEDVARNRRRDFYLHLPLTVGDLDGGTYELQVAVEDVNRSASATLPIVKFSVE